MVPRPPAPLKGKTTVSVDSNPLSRASLETPLATVLAIAWSADQPSRVGEVAVLSENGKPQVLGRDEDEGGGEDRVRFLQQRPGKLVPSSALTAPGLSRRQLVIRANVASGVEIENVGSCPLFVNGERRERASLADGDVVYLRRQLLLLLLRRPALIPPSRHFPRSAYGEFGQPDAPG